MRDEWGCDEPKQSPVWQDNDFEFYNCPLSMVHPDALRFVQLYNYGKNSGAGVPIERLTALYFEMMTMYNAYSNDFQEQKATMNRGAKLHG